MTGSFLLLSKLLFWSKKKGDSPAVIEADTDKSISYQELLWAIKDISFLFGQEEKKIMLVLPGNIPSCVIWITSLISGHMLLPVSPYLTTPEYKMLITKHKPDIVISQTNNFPKKTNITKINLSLIQKTIDKAIKNKKSPLPSFKVKGGKILLFTSGSTGEPKGILLNSRQIINTADNIRKSHKLTKDDRGLTPLPLFHVNAPVVSLFSIMLSGGTLIISSKYSTSRFWSWVEKYDPTWISAVPTFIAMLLSTDKPLFLAKSSLRFIRTASAPLPVANLKKFEKKFGVPLIETYGISEAASTITANPTDPKKRKIGSVGLPVGVTIKIYNTDHQKNKRRLVKTGKIGEICVTGKSVIKTYEGNVSNGSFFNNYFRTGDLGFADKDGFIYITGRIKDVIIRGGEKVFPKEIEEVLLGYPDIQEACVVGHPDPIYGEKVVSFVVLNSNLKNKNVILEKIKSYAKEHLSPQKKPAEIYILKQLPRGKTGKIDKKTLRQYSQ